MRQYVLENGDVNTGTFPTTSSKGAAEEQEEGTGKSSCRKSESQQAALTLNHSIILYG